MALQSLRFLSIAPIAQHTATVIFLHGLGDTGEGWKFMADMFAPKLPHVKWILPHAFNQPVTINFGMECPSWYDIQSLDKIDGPEDEKGMLVSSRQINQLITAEVDAGIKSDRIVLGGFSQGAAMSLLTGLTTERRLAGLVALSGYAPLRNKLKSMLSDHAKKLPIFMGHGTADPVVKFEIGQKSAQILTSEFGLKCASSTAEDMTGVIFNQYDGLQHSADPRELRALLEWMGKVIPA
ncbi:Phospholipase/carboxylesterase [Sistotremastrum niveocremeum HHB9708]|uniref:Acyl-protein thioesterase 1 n=1 Tax=Sistotremastrum niveocremeum HHB9708 TaxID=1314777 RepID=A0A164ZLY7_9AGAM|nr:Phospholipase/carboxylesterase [Sistotremastrum niveocremeum HHB9708]